MHNLVFEQKLGKYRTLYTLTVFFFKYICIKIKAKGCLGLGKVKGMQPRPVPACSSARSCKCLAQNRHLTVVELPSIRNRSYTSGHFI